MRQRHKQGFSLVETIVALLIVTLVMSAIGAGVQAGAGIHQDGRFTSESELLAESIHSTLGDLLRHASEISEGDAPTFRSGGYGAGTLESAGGRVVLVTDAGQHPLLGEGAYTNLLVQDLRLSYTDGLFQGSYDIVGSWNSSLTKTITFVFRPVNG